MASRTTDAEKAAAERAEASRRFAEIALDDAYVIREESSRLAERRRANRDQLRSLAAQEMLTDEQMTELEELYPRRERNSSTDAETDAETEGVTA